MAPPTIHKGGTHNVHFLADFNRFKEFKEICHKQGKPYGQILNDFINQELERNAIGEEQGIEESISCLGYTPKPVQQKITESITINNNTSEEGIESLLTPSLDKVRDKLQTSKDLKKIGRVLGHHTEITTICKIWRERVKRETLTV